MRSPTSLIHCNIPIADQPSINVYKILAHFLYNWSINQSNPQARKQNALQVLETDDQWEARLETD